MRARLAKENSKKIPEDTQAVHTDWWGHFPLALPPPRHAVSSQGKLGLGHLRRWTERAWSWQKRPQLLQWSPGAPPIFIKKEISAGDRGARRLFLLDQPRPNPQILQRLHQRKHIGIGPEGTQTWATGYNHTVVT